jgi:hypothetical protein
VLGARVELADLCGRWILSPRKRFFTRYHVYVVDPNLSSKGAGAAYDLATKTFRIHPDWIDSDLALVHELIHHYDHGLQAMLWRDFVVIRLYEKLRNVIPNLWEHCKSHFSAIVPRCVFTSHTFLFLLMSLYFDRKLELPLGSILNYYKREASSENHEQVLANSFTDGV